MQYYTLQFAVNYLFFGGYSSLRKNIKNVWNVPDILESELFKLRGLISVCNSCFKQVDGLVDVSCL